MKFFSSRAIAVLVLILSCFHSIGQNNDMRLLLQQAEKDLGAQKYSDALPKARKVFDTAVATEDSLLKGESSLLLGKIYRMQPDNYLLALEYLFKARRNFENNPPRKYEVLKVIGDLYSDRGGYRKAIYYYREAEKFSPDQGRKKLVMEAMGDSYNKLGQIKEALSYYKGCLEMTDTNEYDTRLRLYKNQSELYYKLNDYDQALAMDFKQLSLVSHTSTPVRKPVILNDIGFLYKNKGDDNSALTYYKKSREVSQAAGDAQSLYTALLNIGVIQNVLGQLDSSRTTLTNLLSIVVNDPDEQKEATVKNRLAATLSNLGKCTQAQEQNKAAIAIAEKKNVPFLLKECYFTQWEILKKCGKEKEQSEFYVKYKQLNDNLEREKVLYQQQQIRTDSLASMEEKQVQMDLLLQENTYLTSKELEKDKALLSKEVMMKRLALENEKAFLRLANEELQGSEHKARILSLLNENSGKEIENQKQKLKNQQLENDWSELEKKNLMLEYTNLEKELALNRTRQVRQWILIAFTVGILIIIMLFAYYRQSRNAKEDKLKLVNLEIQQRLLRSQMNPHFLFNSLNSIQGFITSNDTAKADRFLACYARLMRSILDNTSREKVLLNEEVNALRSYIELEQMRMDNSFSYSIDIGDLEEDIIAIPPMLIQPYVENAILHGLRHKTDYGHLTISFSQDGKYLRCDIEDDGIGREASQKINSSRKKEHRSIAMNLTKERLKLLNKQENSNMDVYIEDLVSPSGEPMGTKVTLKIVLDEWI